MQRLDQNKILKGTNGYLWINDKFMAHIKKVEIKVTGTFEDVSVCSSYATYPVYTGWSGEGTLTFQKINSEFLTLMAKAFKEDIMPSIKIVSKLEDRPTKKAERIAIYNVVFTEFNPIQQEVPHF